MTIYIDMESYKSLKYEKRPFIYVDQVIRRIFIYSLIKNGDYSYISGRAEKRTIQKGRKRTRHARSAHAGN